VLDCFGGSGTTLIAAHKTGRRGYLIELDPLYVDLIVKRYEQLTGEPAIHAASGSTFIQVQSERASGNAPAQEMAAELGGGNSVE
jgi:DNA modification methylase